MPIINPPLDIEEIKANLDNDGAVLTTGLGSFFYTTTYRGIIVAWYITGSPSGSIVIDVLKKNAAIPTTSDSIAGTEKPTLSSQQLNNNTTLSSWSRDVVPGDVFGINIESVSSLTGCVLTLSIQRT